MSEQKYTPEPLCPATLPFAIMDQEMEDLMRFHECVTDDEGYDVPKDRMKRLAEIGLLRRVTANFYEHTIFGLSIINGNFQQKSEVEKQRDSFKDAAEYNKRRAEDAERQRDELLKQVESIAFRIANKEYGHAALDCEEALAGAKGQVPDATKMIGAPATANYPHGSLGENVDSEGGAA